MFTEFDPIVKFMAKMFLEQKFNLRTTMLHKNSNYIKFHVGANKVQSKYDEKKFFTTFLI